MPEINDGGPAYPSHGTMGEVAHEGMSLRDHFAGLAMQGMLANQHPYQASDEHMFARDSYVLADAMLRARNAQPQDPQEGNHG